MREYLTGPRTYYVDPASSDSNDGLTVSTPFQHIWYAVQLVATTLDVAGQKVKIKLANSTYNETVKLLPVVGYLTLGGHDDLIIEGDLTTPSNVLINGGAGHCTSAVNCWTPWRFDGVKFQGAGNALYADFHSKIYFGRVEFGSCGVHISANYRSSIEYVSPITAHASEYWITGGASAHMSAFQNSMILAQPGTVNLVGTPNFTNAFAFGQDNSTFEIVPLTFSGAATGMRFDLYTGTGLQSGGGTPNRLPGNVTGRINSVTLSGSSMGTAWAV